MPADVGRQRRGFLQARRHPAGAASAPSSMPSVSDTASIDEPPAEMNGSVMPLAGSRPTLTRHVDQRLQPEQQRQP